MKRLLLVGMCLMGLVSNGQSGEIGFAEDFALSQNREEALRQLIPGTEEYYYWHCLHLLNTEKYAEVAPLLTTWVQRHGETAGVWEIRTRYAVLTYDQSPDASLKYLRDRFGIHHPHQKDQLNAEPNLPTALDPNLISRRTYTQRALAIHQQNINGFEDASFDWLLTQALNENQRRQLLSRLSRPDYPGLVKLIVDDLNAPRSGGFGSLTVHGQLLLTQLEELVKLKPDVLNHQNFVRAYLVKLQPSADVDWRNDQDELAAYLNRVQQFANRLAPVHNTLKAHVLYHRLLLERSQGRYNKDLLMEYLQLPRQSFYMSTAMANSEALRRFGCDLNSNYDGTTLLAPIGNDEPLVRSYLTHLFVDAANSKEYEPYINDNYLRALFAETKIVNGLGDQERWASLLTPEQFRQLRERVELEFVAQNKTNFARDEAVQLELNVKNASTLIVKVFEINAESFYRRTEQEVDTDINLDGLVANSEQTYNIDESPLRRIRRRFDFPTLNKPGVYIIDFIGNGQSSRALVRKGFLRHLVRTTPVGQSFTLLDEQGNQVAGAKAWVAGHEYAAGENGQIVVPFSTNPGRQSVVFTAPSDDQGDTYSSLGHFNHEAENYEFVAGIFVDREALLTRRQAQVVIRPQLSINGTPISLSRLEDVRLTISSIDHEGTRSTSEIPNFELFEDRESVHDFQVPQRLASLTFALSAKVKQLATGQKQSVGASQSFSLNGIDKSDKTEDLHLIRSGTNYILELRGKSGEPRPSRPVHFQFKHRDFKDQMPVSLKTDPQGRILLGALPDIQYFSASGPQGTQHSWSPGDNEFTYANTVHGRVGTPFELPYLGTAEAPTREEFSLLEVRNNTYNIDRIEHLSIKNGMLHIADLPAGDFELLLKKQNRRIRLRNIPGEQVGQYVVGDVRQAETPRLQPLHITSVSSADGKVQVQLRNATKFTRVHLFATRFEPEYDAYQHLSRVRASEPYLFTYRRAGSVYLTGRNIGDEYRYIIDRKYASKYPGNMLERPSLLLNPWAIRDTETGEQIAASGGEFGAVAEPSAAAATRDPQAAPKPDASQTNFANLDFLADASAVLTNLAPDENGVIEIPLDSLGPHQDLHVVAVDPLSTASRRLTLPEQKLTFLDLRLVQGLDPQQHFTMQKLIDVVPNGQEFVLRDVVTSKFEKYDSLARVYGLLTTLNGDSNFREFSFLLTWPDLSDEEKQTLYSKYACHELSFFLYKKDPAFFTRVIEPYLQNKKDKTFVDRFLLNEDLSEYLLPWKYGQLNAFERILLARRIDGEQDKTARHLIDMLALVPPNIDHFNRLFDTAVQQSALELGGTTSLETNLSLIIRQEQEKLLLSDEMAADMAMPAMSAPGGEAGGYGGMGGVQMGRGAVVRENLARQRAAGRESKEEAGERMDEFRKKTPQRRSLAAARDRAEIMLDDKAVEFDSYFGDIDADGVMAIRQLYRQMEKTKEWAENNYYHLTIDQQNADLVPVSKFWTDYAAHNPAEPFVSTNLAEAARNFPDMVLALAVLDLPFKAAEHDVKFNEKQMTFTPTGPVVVFHEEIRPADAPDGTNKVLVSQNFYKNGERHRTELGEQVDNFVTDEFLVHTVYGCEVVITNPTSTRQKLSALVQIPLGALPVSGSQTTRTFHIDVEPYHTHKLEYQFYFPAAADLAHFPVHIARNEKLIAAAEPFTFHVVQQPSKVDTNSWDYISQNGSLAEVVQFLETHNIHELNLDRVAWRMHDRNAFDTILPLLAQRHVYSHTLWSYALLHNVAGPAREYLQHAENVVNELGGRIQSTLVSIDPIERRTYQYLEYKPLVNARAHALGKRRQIVNDTLLGQYHQYMKELGYERALDDEELLGVTYYLLLQDRIEESLATFARVGRDNVATKMQYDYCKAYLAFFSDDPNQARAIAEKYTDHPVDRWRTTFQAIVAQLEEAGGGDALALDEEDRTSQQDALAATEPTFEFQIEGKDLNVNYQNLDVVTVNFYEMDVELLFSRTPFVHQFGDEFTAIKPNHSVSVSLAKNKSQKSIPIPEQFHSRNVLVEVVSAGKAQSLPYFSNVLSVQVVENYGQVRVTHRDTRKPVSTCYVKVYAQLADGSVKFYKDGYTDIRGRFDYASLNTNQLDGATRFAILTLSEEHGAVVREALPPKR